MPWQRAGSVAVQTGSTTVTGTNVDFAASSRTGDSFIGPDGFTYEVANVASSTVISILPAYKGPTASGAAYAIMPVQGYDKMLSDAFNALNNQFGPKLAALGTTGNYDILPVSKGGSGASNDVSARDNLGLANRSARLRLADLGIGSASNGFGTQGAYFGWNGSEAGGFSGEVNFICNRGGGTGGFTFRSVNADNTATGPVMTYSYDGILTIPTELRVPKMSAVWITGQPNLGRGGGLYLGWNESGGRGEVNFTCNNDGALGGFSWRSTNKGNTQTGPVMEYSYSGNLSVPGAVSQSSDRRLKTNDVEITGGLDKVLQIRPVEFDRRSMLTDKEYPFHEAGVIAQELYDVLPILVTPGGVDDEEEIWRVNYTGLIPYLISAIKELKSEIEELKAGKTDPA